MISFISIIIYIAIFNANYFIINTEKPSNFNNIFRNTTLNISNISRSDKNNITLKNNISYTPSLKSKFCYIKCNCFFSHSVANDNICVKNWIKPIGFN
jgi:hypothetical protein